MKGKYIDLLGVFYLILKFVDSLIQVKCLWKDHLWV